MDIDNLIKIMQASIAPCLLISGYGFILLTMTNRLGRATDLIRSLNEKALQTEAAERKGVIAQIRVLFIRCRVLQAAIFVLALCIFFVALTVLLLFSALVLNLNARLFIQVLFSGSIISLLFSLSFFLVDIFLTLRSLRIYIEENLS